MHARCMQPQTLNESCNRTRVSKERVRGEGRGQGEVQGDIVHQGILPMHTTYMQRNMTQYLLLDVYYKG